MWAAASKTSSERLGPPATSPKAGRGTAFGDIDNNGTVDVAINNVHETPDLFLTSAPAANHWLLAPAGRHPVESERHRRARDACAPGRSCRSQEVRGGGSYISQNDLRVHFGLGATSRVDRLEVRWPNGLEEVWQGVAVNQVLTLTEGTGTPMPQRP